MAPSVELSRKMAEAFETLTSELKKESDRGCVVLAIAWIEDDLTRLLKGYCLPSIQAQEHEDEVFGVSSPVGTFSAKINLAYRLGLIRPPVRKCLHLCRRMRNDFAHRSSRLSFDTPSVRDRVLEIFKLNEEILEAIWHTMKSVQSAELLLQQMDGKSAIHSLETTIGTRTLFHWTAATIVAGLIRASGEVQTIQPLLDNVE